MRIIYNFIFPLAFVFFIPGMIYKLIRRPGYKKNFLERFAVYSADKKNELEKKENPVWVHSVSVGETVMALSLISKWKEMKSEKQFVLSTTTTTGQAIARARAPKDVTVIYCPLDFDPFVKKAVNLIKPSMLVILETEIWPNLLFYANEYCKKVFLVNARLSDKSAKGYVRFKNFFRPVLENFSAICVQSEEDKKRFEAITPDLQIFTCDNMKFDQIPPKAKTDKINPDDCFGKNNYRILLGASTHAGEEKLIAETFMKLKYDFPNLKLVLVPRHAERARAISAELDSLDLPFHRRSSASPPLEETECLLADTTGELQDFISLADLVIMGKSLAGHDEGHNLIEPALMGKAVICGNTLRNFRFVLEVLKKEDAIITINSDGELEDAVRKLLNSDTLRKEIGNRAKQAIKAHRGGTDKTIKILEDMLDKTNI